MKTLLFVYGTLKRGLKSHHFMAGQEFVSEATSLPLYRLYACGRHPGLMYDPDTGIEIRGELWRIDGECLAKLDEYEGVPDLFVRAEIAVRHTTETVQAYFYNRPIQPGTPSGGEWPFPA